MCKYCEHGIIIGKSEIDFGVLAKGTMVLDMRTDEGDHDLCITIIGFNGNAIHTAFHTINYCPMCGRKLEAANE